MNNIVDFVNDLSSEFGSTKVDSADKHISALLFLKNTISSHFMSNLAINDFIKSELVKLYSNEINCAQFSTNVINFLSNYIKYSLSLVYQEIESDDFWNKTYKEVLL